MNIAIIGAGGYGREVMFWAKKAHVCTFYVEDAYAADTYIKDIKPLSLFDPSVECVVVAIADPTIRKRVVESLPKETKYATLIHPSVMIGKDVVIDEGCIISQGCILTTEIRVRPHTQLNLQTTVGHDCVIGDYFTSAPSVNISGNVNIGGCVYMGTGAMVREKTTICNNVTIGMGGVVLNDITEPGTYVGMPVKLLSL